MFDCKINNLLTFEDILKKLRYSECLRKGFHLLTEQSRSECPSETNHIYIITNNKEKDGVIVPENDKLHS